jgi:hypothetical protein
MGPAGIWRPREWTSPEEVLLKPTITYGEEPGDFHPIIDEWGREWVVPEPGLGLSFPGPNDLRARGRSWACHNLAPLTFEPGEGVR